MTNKLYASIMNEAMNREFGDLDEVEFEGMDERYDEIYDAVTSAGCADNTYRKFITFLLTHKRAGRVQIQKFFLSIIPNGDLNYILFNN